MFIQPFLAMALAEHTGIYNGNIGHIVGNALSDIAEDGKHYEHLKQNPDLIVDMIQLQLEKLGYRYDKDKLREMMRTAVEKAGKIVDKLYNKYQEDHLKALRTALKADNPFPVLKQAGIDIEPELEEFRQFLAEISGKRVEKKSAPSLPTSGSGTLAELGEASLEVFSILRALKFISYNGEAVNNAIRELEEKIDEITGLEEPSSQDVYRLGLYYLALDYVRKGKFEKAERVFRNL
ncbi:MAG: hypothetical protein J7L37_02295 [Thermococcus sp.]|nr:hypothetical protein [Thermococcus sp.]